MVYKKELQSKMDEIRDGKLNRRPGQMRRCRDFLKEVKNSKDPFLLGFAFYYLADIYFQTGKADHLYVGYVTKALPYLGTSKNNELLARSYNLLGINAINNGNFQLGLDYFLNSIRFLEDESTALKAMLYFNIGQIYDSLGNLKSALKYIRDANHLVKKAGIANNLFLYMYCLCAEGTYNLERGRIASARHSLESLRKLIEQFPDFEAPHKNLFALSFGIMIFHEIGDTDSLSQLTDEFFSFLKKGEYQTDAITEITAVGRFFAFNGMKREVELLIELFAPVALSSDSSFIRMTCAENLTDYYRSIGDDEKYSEMLKVYFDASMMHKKESNKAYEYALSLRQQMEAVEAENRRLMIQAGTDALTGLPNRYALNEKMDEIFHEARDTQQSLGIEILDVDYFKEFNDTYGHQAGDTCLISIADVIRTEIYDLCRDGDERSVFAARYGGDEFVIIYLGFEDDELMSVAGRMRKRVSELDLRLTSKDYDFPISISQGIRNSIPTADNRVWDYLYTADNALYQVKKTKKGEIELLHKALISDTSFTDAARS